MRTLKATDFIRLGCASIALVGLMAPSYAGSNDRARPPIAYPENFRSWSHISSSIAGPANPAAPKYQGMHHIYANRTALEGYKTGRFRDGSIIVFDLWNAKLNHNDSVTAENRKFIDVMVKDSARFGSTDGWGYAEFMSPGKRRVTAIESEPQKNCHGCHQTTAKSGFVFSRLPQDL